MCGGDVGARRRVRDARRGVASPSAARLGGDGVGGRLPPLTEWWESFRVAQTREVWRELGPWVESSGAMSTFGPGFGIGSKARPRVGGGRGGGGGDARKNHGENGRHRGERNGADTADDAGATGGGGFDGGGGAGVPRATAGATTAAGMAGLPQITAPAGVVDGAPIGLSLIGREGRIRRCSGWRASCGGREAGGRDYRGRMGRT